MMTGVSAIMAKRGQRRWIKVAQGAVALVVVAAGILALWYRHTYNVWPGQAASSRVHWCGRDYETGGGSQTWQQITSQQSAPVRPVGWYPPVAWAPQELFAAVTSQAQRSSVSPPLPCAMVVYLRAGPGKYRAYSLLGGP